MLDAILKFLPQTAAAVRTLFLVIAAVAVFTLTQPDETLRSLVGDAALIPLKFGLGALIAALVAIDPSLVAQRSREAR